MNHNTIYYIIALVMVTLGLIIFSIGTKAHAGGPWIDQYCDVETTQIRVVDADGNVLESKVEEKVVCNDGAADFLQDCLLYTSPSPRDLSTSRMPSSA